MIFLQRTLKEVLELRWKSKTIIALQTKIVFEGGML